MPPETATAALAAPHGPGETSAAPPRPTTPRQRRRALRHDRTRRRRIAERIAADPTLTDLTKTAQCSGRCHHGQTGGAVGR